MAGKRRKGYMRKALCKAKKLAFSCVCLPVLCCSGLDVESLPGDLSERNEDEGRMQEEAKETGYGYVSTDRFRQTLRDIMCREDIWDDYSTPFQLQMHLEDAKDGASSPRAQQTFSSTMVQFSLDVNDTPNVNEDNETGLVADNVLLVCPPTRINRALNVDFNVYEILEGGGTNTHGFLNRTQPPLVDQLVQLPVVIPLRRELERHEALNMFMPDSQPPLVYQLSELSVVRYTLGSELVRHEDLSIFRPNSPPVADHLENLVIVQNSLGRVLSRQYETLSMFMPDLPSLVDQLAEFVNLRTPHRRELGRPEALNMFVPDSAVIRMITADSTSMVPLRINERNFVSFFSQIARFLTLLGSGELQGQYQVRQISSMNTSMAISYISVLGGWQQSDQNTFARASDSLLPQLYQESNQFEGLTSCIALTESYYCLHSDGPYLFSFVVRTIEVIRFNLECSMLMGSFQRYVGISYNEVHDAVSQIQIIFREGELERVHSLLIFGHLAPCDGVSIDNALGVFGSSDLILPYPIAPPSANAPFLLFYNPSRADATAVHICSVSLCAGLDVSSSGQLEEVCQGGRTPIELDENVMLHTDESITELDHRVCCVDSCDRLFVYTTFEDDAIRVFDTDGLRQCLRITPSGNVPSSLFYNPSRGGAKAFLMCSDGLTIELDAPDGDMEHCDLKEVCEGDDGVIQGVSHQSIDSTPIENLNKSFPSSLKAHDSMNDDGDSYILVGTIRIHLSWPGMARDNEHESNTIEISTRQMEKENKTCGEDGPAKKRGLYGEDEPTEKPLIFLHRDQRAYCEANADTDSYVMVGSVPIWLGKALTNEHKEEIRKSSTPLTGSEDGDKKNTEKRMFLTRRQRENLRFHNVVRKKDFICWEKVMGKELNILQGLELHERMFSAAEQERIVKCVYDLQYKGRKGELKEHTYYEPRKWIPGKRKVTIRSGCCYDLFMDNNGNSSSAIQDGYVPIPKLFKIMIKRLVEWHVIPPWCVPDSCTVTIYEPGDSEPPHVESRDFLRPFCTVSLLSECAMLFGSNIRVRGPGVYYGSSEILLPLGSVLVFNGNGADVAQHCVPSVTSKRISITFWKLSEGKQQLGFVPEQDLLGIQPNKFDD